MMDDEQKPPEATHYTIVEGGDWFEWKYRCGDAGDIFAVKFSNDWIWDSLIGWRKSRG